MTEDEFRFDTQLILQTLYLIKQIPDVLCQRKVTAVFGYAFFVLCIGCEIIFLATVQLFVQLLGMYVYPVRIDILPLERAQLSHPYTGLYRKEHRESADIVSAVFVLCHPQPYFLFQALDLLGGEDLFLGLWL